MFLPPSPLTALILTQLSKRERENACVRVEDGRECVFKGILIIVTVEKGNFRVSDGKREGREGERGRESDRLRTRLSKKASTTSPSFTPS